MISDQTAPFSISTILVARFLLDLREMIARGSSAFQATTALTSNFESVNFAHNVAESGKSGSKVSGRQTHTDKPGHGLSIVRDFEDMSPYLRSEDQDNDESYVLRPGEYSQRAHSSSIHLDDLDHARVRGEGMDGEHYQP